MEYAILLFMLRPGSHISNHGFYSSDDCSTRGVHEDDLLKHVAFAIDSLAKGPNAYLFLCLILTLGFRRPPPRLCTTAFVACLCITSLPGGCVPLCIFTSLGISAQLLIRPRFHASQSRISLAIRWTPSYAATLHQTVNPQPQCIFPIGVVCPTTHNLGPFLFWAQRFPFSGVVLARNAAWRNLAPTGSEIRCDMAGRRGARRGTSPLTF